MIIKKWIRNEKVMVSQIKEMSKKTNKPPNTTKPVPKINNFFFYVAFLLLEFRDDL